jgi:hypothetical protein
VLFCSERGLELLEGALLLLEQLLEDLDCSLSKTCSKNS